MPLPLYNGAPKAPARHTSRAFEVILLLPPDQDLSMILRRHKFPPQGPAILAAALAVDNVHVRVADIDLSLLHRPLESNMLIADDEPRVTAHLQGRNDPELEQLASELIARIDDPRCDAFALSLERYPQVCLSALLGYELKRRFGKPVIMGGVVGSEPFSYLSRAKIRGIDIAAAASTPEALRVVFGVLREMPQHRMELATDLHDQYPERLIPDDYPVPDYSIYRLEDYRRDPLAHDAATYGAYDGSIGRQLVLGYNSVFNCLYACQFCTSARTPQVAKSNEKVVRDLATLAERYDTVDFAFMNTQMNLEAPALADAMIAARLGLRWSDSYRVSPSKPGMMEKLARAGCVALTLGVESANSRMLKKMLKGYGRDDATRVVREAHDAEIMLRVNLLPCFPGETRGEFVETRDWLEEHSFAIDDLSASSFYLVPGAGIGSKPDENGIRLRERRKLTGELRTRKNMGSLSYDEVGGMTWEEREPTLEAYEQELRDTWRRGRARLGDRMAYVLTISHENALRRRFPRKKEAYAALREWSRLQDRSAERADAPRPGPAGPAPVVKPLVPLPAESSWSSRFDSALAHALPRLTEMLGRTVYGHFALFDDGDYLCFGGHVERDAEGQPRAFRLDVILGERLRGSRKQLYGRLRPGAMLDVLPTMLRAGEGSGRWEEPLLLHGEYELVSFGVD